MKRLFFTAIIFSFFCACETSRNTETTTDTTTVEEINTATPEAITVEPMSESPDFPDAMLRLNAPAESANLQPGVQDFKYDITNYQLTAQTADADMKQCANSDKGQHIHFILNNEPYDALYEPNHQKELAEGNHVVLSFLSRSYHESLKHPDAYVLRQFTVGKGNAQKADLNAPHMFYSRPKGEYKGADTENIMLDFYLVNTELSANGNKVRATVNGESFMLDNWQPYIINGMPMGENTIKLELVDNSGNVIPGPFNTVERIVTLVEG